MCFGVLLGKNGEKTRILLNVKGGGGERLSLGRSRVKSLRVSGSPIAAFLNRKKSGGNSN